MTVAFGRPPRHRPEKLRDQGLMVGRCTEPLKLETERQGVALLCTHLGTKPFQGERTAGGIAASTFL